MAFNVLLLALKQGSDPEKYLADNMNAYMRACIDGEALIRRWRLMVLGPSGDGKTSLINRLLGKGFNEDHVITNALETDCKVEITHVDKEWKEYEKNHLNLLDESVTEGIGKFILHESTDIAAEPDEVRKQEKINDISKQEKITDISVKFDEMMELEEEKEAKIRLETIFHQRNETDLRTLEKDDEGNQNSKKDNFGILKFIFSIWDLGGQVMYHILHHIFLRCHCVYIIVVNLSRPLHSHVPSHELPPHTRKKVMKYYESIEFWVNMVFSHMSKVQDKTELPSIVLVGTHKDLLDDNPQQQDRLAQEYLSELQSLFLKKAHFQQLHSQFIAVDSKNGDPENYAKLRTLIFDLVEMHCNQGRPRPIRWLRLEKKLHELKNDDTLQGVDKHLVSYDTAMKYAKQFHIQTDEDLKLFLEYHHLTADITYCSTQDLGKYIVPNPQWLIDVFRALITLDQFYPRFPKCIQEKNQLQKAGLLKSNGSLLNEVWNQFLEGDSSGSAKQYLLDLMGEFDLAVKYEAGQYIIPCLLPFGSSTELPLFQGLIRNLPSIYYMFHNSVDSFVEVTRGDVAYDNFLPHGLFQKLVAKCSKLGWAWTKDKYQDLVSFSTDDVLISLQARSTWIVLNVFALNYGIAVNYEKYQSAVSGAIIELLKQYHPNMWFERGVNPCMKVEQECVLSIGSTSFDKSDPTLHGVTCEDHMSSLTTPQFTMWFSPSPCRILNEKDLKRVGNELTDEWTQLNVATELDVPTNEINAINADTPDIKMASFKILKYWYDQQVYKVEAFTNLCDALKKAGKAGLIEKALNAKAM